MSDGNRNRQLPALVRYGRAGENRRHGGAYCGHQSRLPGGNPPVYRPTEQRILAGLGVDYVIDAIDDIWQKSGLPLSATGGDSVGCGAQYSNKLQPELLETADIYETSVCPLALMLRRELRQAGVRALRVVYSRRNRAAPFLRPAKNECRARSLLYRRWQECCWRER